MKTKGLTNRQVAHLWAQQTVPEGEAENMYFVGAVIYSYGRHYPIARFTGLTQGGDQIVLFNSTHSTQTTEGKHKHAVRGALRGLPVRVVEVANPMASGAAILRAVVDEYEGHLKEVAKGRTNSMRVSHALQDATAAHEWLIAVAIALNLPIPDITPLPAVAAEVQTFRDRYAAAQTEARKAERAKYRAELGAFERGEINHVMQPPGVPEDTRLRLSTNGRMILTSRGAEVPVTAAKAVWELAKTARRTRTRYLGGPFVSVGGFKLHEIDINGYVTIGCHTIRWAELERFAKVLKLPGYVPGNEEEAA